MATPARAATRRPPEEIRKGIWTEKIEGRFRRITGRQIAMAWWCYSARHITKRQLRVWFAAHEMLERRRYTALPDTPREAKRKPLYGLDEIKTLIGGRGSKTAGAALTSDVKRLGRLGLVHISDHTIEFATSIEQLALDDVEGFWEMFNQLPHKNRSVPVPRRVLRALAGGFTTGMTAVVLAALIRSLFWHKSEGAYRTDGRTKRDWIVRVFGVSERTVTDGRARLIELGWLVPIVAPQWLLNRYGAHDHINTGWAPQSAESGAGEANDNAGESASPSGVSSGESASPDLDSSSSPSGNLHTRSSAPKRAGPSGDCFQSDSRGRKKGKQALAPPNIRSIRAEDLGDTARLLELHKQAAELGMVSRGEAGRFEFVALAERARRRGLRAGTLFYWLLSKRKTEFITHSDEEGAARRLKEHLYGNPQPRRRGESSDRSDSAGDTDLSEDHRTVLICIRVARQHRIDDPYRIAQRSKGWTRDRWDSALASYEHEQRERSHAQIIGLCQDGDS